MQRKGIVLVVATLALAATGLAALSTSGADEDQRAVDMGLKCPPEDLLAVTQFESDEQGSESPEESILIFLEAYAPGLLSETSIAAAPETLASSERELVEFTATHDDAVVARVIAEHGPSGWVVSQVRACSSWDRRGVSS